MEQIKRAVTILRQNWIVILPIYLTRLLPALLSLYIFSEISEELVNLLSVEEIGETQYVLENYEQVTREFFQANREYILASFFLGVLGLILNFITVPATFGMIEEILVKDTEVDLSRVFPNLGRYFGKYLLYRISKLALWIFLFMVSLFLFVGVGFLGSMVDQGMAVLLVMLLGLGLFLGAVVLHLILKLWFPAMVLEGIGIFEGLRQAFRKSKICFWPLALGVLGIRIVSWITNMFVDMVVGDLSYVGPFLTNAVPAAATVLLLVLYLLLYQEAKKQMVKEEETG